MTKPYFAKYLPVEGEIKLNAGEHIIGSNVFFGDTVVRSAIPEVSKKLFLCSRDNKPIGEINPKAKWVKEGDEFDETQILMMNNYPFVIGRYVFLKCPCCEEWK